MNKTAFKEEIERIERQIATVQKLDAVNTKLQAFNWGFLHPYSQGGDIGLLERFASSENAEEQILSFFAHKFLDLRNTIHMIDGFFKKRPFLRDYVNSIEESVVLCLQKDFKGAISILLPVIEGTLRKYLVDKKGEHKKKEIDISKLLNSIEDLKSDYIDLEKGYLKSRHNNLLVSDNYFDVNQEKAILNKHKQYFDLWMKQLRNYLEENLYRNTRENEPSDKFNRHLIFHALDDGVEFTFANYLRLYNCVNYLSWVIGLTNDECSVLSEANEQDVMDRWADYLKILTISEALTETKASVLGKEVESFKKYMPKEYSPLIGDAEREVKLILDNYDTLKSFEKRKITSIPKIFRNFLFFNTVRKANKKMQ